MISRSDSSGASPASGTDGVATDPARTGSLAGTVVGAVLCCVLAVWAVGTGWFSILFGFASDSCNPHCDFGVMQAGILLAMFGSILVMVVAVVIAIVRGIRHRRFVWLVPILGFVGCAIVWWAGALLVEVASNGHLFGAGY